MGGIFPQNSKKTGLCVTAENHKKLFGMYKLRINRDSQQGYRLRVATAAENKQSDGKIDHVVSPGGNPVLDHDKWRLK